MLRSVWWPLSQCLLEGGLSVRPDRTFWSRASQVCVGAESQPVGLVTFPVSRNCPSTSNHPSPPLQWVAGVWGMTYLYWDLTYPFPFFWWLNFCYIYRHLLQKLLKRSGTSLPWTPCTGMSFSCSPALGAACCQAGACWHFIYHLPFCCNEVEIFAELSHTFLVWDVNFIHCWNQSFENLCNLETR